MLSISIAYLFDHTGSFNIRAMNRLTALLAAGDEIAVSDLSRLECRVGPIKVGDTAKLAASTRSSPDPRCIWSRCRQRCSTGPR